MLKDCQFCSVISKAKGEDPIGTASQHDYWLLIDLPLPWRFEDWQRDPTVGPLIKLFEQLIVKEKMTLRPLAIAPDSDYSQPGYHRVLFYRRPARLFNQYEKQEYLVPAERLSELVVTLLKAPEQLADFETYQQPAFTRDILVCTHGNVDVACSRFGEPIYKTLRKEYATAELRVWRCSHFGGHRFAPTLIDLPTGQFFGHIELGHLDALVYRRGDWQQLRNCYRGWAGVNAFEQIAEREIWMQLGWMWFDYLKSGKAETKSLVELDSSAVTTVEIEFEDIQRNRHVYQADIEPIEAVEIASKSGVDIELEHVPQYIISRFSKRT